MPNKKIKVRYIKVNDYRTVLSTGIVGAVGTNGLISANFYVDRPTIAKSEIIEVDENGKKVGVSEREFDGDAVREVQFGTLLDIKTAKNVVKWLSERIVEHESKTKK